MRNWAERLFGVETNSRCSILALFLTLWLQPQQTVQGKGHICRTQVINAQFLIQQEMATVSLRRYVFETLARLNHIFEAGNLNNFGVPSPPPPLAAHYSKSCMSWHSLVCATYGCNCHSVLNRLTKSDRIFRGHQSQASLGKPESRWQNVAKRTSFLVLLIKATNRIGMNRHCR